MNNYALLVSVIVPVYNQQAYLKRCLRSLLGQTLPETQVEILLIDDGSTDGSATMCRQYAARYSHIHYHAKPHSGVSGTRNWGIQKARGRFLFFLDGDDALAPATLEAVSSFFLLQEEEVGLVTYPRTTIYKNKTFFPTYHYKTLREPGVYSLQDYPYTAPATLNIAIRNHGPHTQLFQTALEVLEDLDFCFRLLAKKPSIGFCPQGEYLYYRRDSSSSAGYTAPGEMTQVMLGIVEAGLPPGTPLLPGLQGLLAYEIFWKYQMGILLPEGPEAFPMQSRLLSLCLLFEDSILLNHPGIDPAGKLFLLALKEQASPARSVILAHGSTAALLHKTQGPLYASRKLFFMVESLGGNDSPWVKGRLYSPILGFTQEAVGCFCGFEGKTLSTTVEPALPGLPFYRRVSVKLPGSAGAPITFTVEVQGHRYPLELIFKDSCGLCPTLGRMDLVRGGYLFHASPSGLAVSAAPQELRKALIRRQTLRLLPSHPLLGIMRLCRFRLTTLRTKHTAFFSDL